MWKKMKLQDPKDMGTPSEAQAVSSKSGSSRYLLRCGRSKAKGHSAATYQPNARTLRSSTCPNFNPKIEINPLLLPDVVSNILSHLEFPYLRNARIVCKQWNEEATRLLPDVSTINLSSFEDVGDFISNHEYDKKKFIRFKLGENLNLQNPLISKFFNKFGPQIVSLQLDWTHWIPASLRKILLEKLPVLEELVLCSQRLSESHRFFLPTRANESEKALTTIKTLKLGATHENFNAQTLLDLLILMPNLELVTKLTSPGNIVVAPICSRLDSLRYEQFDNRMDRTLELPDPNLFFSKLMLRNRETLRLTKIQHIKIVFDPDMIAYLRESSFALKSLEVIIPSNTFAGWYPRPSMLYVFFSTLRVTLQSLKICYCPGKLKLFEGFDGLCRMKNLKHLTLHRVTGSLDFLNSLPQLQSLHMTQENFIEFYDDFHIEESRPHNRLKTLKLYYTQWSASSLYAELPRPAKILNVVDVIVRRFPNLTSFRMESLTDKCLEAIFSNLIDLEELEATNGTFTSAGITGIPVMDQGIFFDGVRKHFHIGYLGKLKKLRLESNKLSDYAVRLMAYDLASQLEELVLLCYKLTDDALESIAYRMECLKLLKTEFCYELTPESISITKEIFNNKGATAILNPFCGQMNVEEIHEYLNENGPIHISTPEFPIYR